MTYYKPKDTKERNLKAKFLKSNKKHLKSFGGNFSRQGLDMIFNTVPEEWILDFIQDFSIISRLFFEINDETLDKYFSYVLDKNDIYMHSLFDSDAGVNIIINN